VRDVTTVRKKAEKATINQLYVAPHTAQYDSISYKMTTQGGKMATANWLSLAAQWWWHWQWLLPARETALVRGWQQ